LKLLPAFCNRPSDVPIHRAFCVFSARQHISSLVNTGSLACAKTRKFTPSKRVSPPSVAIQRKPSCVCRIAWTLFCGRPSSVDHDCRASPLVSWPPAPGPWPPIPRHITVLDSRSKASTPIRQSSILSMERFSERMYWDRNQELFVEKLLEYKLHSSRRNEHSAKTSLGVLLQKEDTFLVLRCPSKSLPDSVSSTRFAYIICYRVP
jgi:hypothetical protein